MSTVSTYAWTDKTVTVDHVEAKPFGNGIDVCPVCGKPSTIGKPQTNADRIRSMTDEELLNLLCLKHCPTSIDPAFKCKDIGNCKPCWEEWLKQEVACGKD